MYIQFTGFNVATNSRIYSFQVRDPAREQRVFTVSIQSDTNHWASLKLQDGPGICFERLELELSRETPEAPAELNLQISEQDIREYMKRHYPPVKTFGHRDLPEQSADSHAAPRTEPLAYIGQPLPEHAPERVPVSVMDAPAEQVTAVVLFRVGNAVDQLKEALEGHSLQVRCLTTVKETLALLQAANPPHLVLTEGMLPDGTWADVVKQANGASQAVKVIVVSRVVDVRLYVDAMDGGAFDFIVPPFSGTKVDYAVNHAVEKVVNLRRAQAAAIERGAELLDAKMARCSQA